MITTADVRTKLPFHINHGMGDVNLRFCKEINPETGWNSFDFDVFLPTKKKNLQRPLVWTLFQKQQLIISVLKGIKLPPVSLIKFNDGIDKDNLYLVVDGKQRLTTLISYINNEFSIYIKNQEVYFRDLHDYLKSDFYNCITSNIGFEYYDKKISDDDKIAWFEMINFAGTPQDEEHLKDLKSEI